MLKEDEAAILAAVRATRAEVYGADVSAPSAACRDRAHRHAAQSAASPFADDGAFRDGERPTLPAVEPECEARYRARYVDFFGTKALEVCCFACLLFVLVAIILYNNNQLRRVSNVR